jgi:hypothetical protein
MPSGRITCNQPRRRPRFAGSGRTTRRQPIAISVTRARVSNSHRRCRFAAGNDEIFSRRQRSTLSILPGYTDVLWQQALIGVDFIRTHDFYGPADIDAQYPPTSLALVDQFGAQNAAIVGPIAGRRVIFLDPTADPENPASYNFAASDNYISSIVQNGAQVFYRIGRSGGGGANPIIDPPSNPTMDPAKYADIVKHVAMHYNQGWASGFHYNIKYWEVWNEPEVVGICWDGTAEQFYPFYAAIASALKSLDPTIQVGGPAAVLAGTPRSLAGRLAAIQ